MKNNKLFIMAYIIITSLCVISFVVFSILGFKERIGYLTEFNINIDKTLELNNLSNIKENFIINGELDEVGLSNYIFTNENITNYSYGFRILYYDKVFRNSDIYGVYIDINKIIEENNFIKEIKMEYEGSPFGILVSDKEIKNIDNVKYILKLKIDFITCSISVLIIIFILYILINYNRQIYSFLFDERYCGVRKIILKSYLSLVFILLLCIIIFSILGNINRIGYLTEFKINMHETLELNDKYVLTNDNAEKLLDEYNNYVYNFRIKYYDKFFRNSDIYGVYIDIDKVLQENDFIKEIKMDGNGSPFGNLVSSKIIEEEKIDNIQYTLKIKLNFVLSFLLFSVILLFSRYIIYFIKSFIIDLIKLFVSLVAKINLSFLKNKYIYILIIFLCFLILPNIVYILFGSYFDKTNYENRLKADKPNLSLADFSNYPNLYEKYFNDYLPFRNELVRLKNLTDIFAFKNIIHNRVLLGKSKWLFFKDANLIEKYIGIEEYDFSENELEEAKNNLITFRDELKNRNMDFIFMVCPDKQFIYDEYMPDYIKRKTTVNNADKFVEYIRKNTDIKIVYPKDELIKYKDKYRLYYKYDTHWNNLGAYVGYTCLMKSLNIGVDGIENSNIKDFEGKNHINFSPHYNDMAGMLSLSKFKYFLDDRFYIISDYINDNYDIVSNVYNSEAYNDENNILIIRDSYSIDMIDYIATEFKESEFIHIDNFKNEDIIEYKPNIVVFRTVERYLKYRILSVLPNYRIEEINEDLENNDNIIND